MSLAFAHKTNRPAPNPAQIQKMLDENGHIIQAIQDYQSKGKGEDCIQYQQLLHRNLVYIASIVDSNYNSPPCDLKSKTELHHLLYQQQSATQENGASERVCSYTDAVGQGQQSLSGQILHQPPACNPQNSTNAYGSSHLPVYITGPHKYENSQSIPIYNPVQILPNQSSYSNIVYAPNPEQNYNSSASGNYGQFTT